MLIGGRTLAITVAWLWWLVLRLLVLEESLLGVVMIICLFAAQLEGDVDNNGEHETRREVCSEHDQRVVRCGFKRSSHEANSIVLLVENSVVVPHEGVAEDPERRVGEAHNFDVTAALVANDVFFRR